VFVGFISFRINNLLLNKQLAVFEMVLSTDLPKLNKQIKEKEIEAIVVKK
jgi:hypothetical protein